uniref:Uncharacterized protein n=1 Tax=Opuntia streptacantha TaxID=393608 RepID=A0A7C9DP78_OPUST
MIIPLNFDVNMPLTFLTLNLLAGKIITHRTIHLHNHFFLNNHHLNLPWNSGKAVQSKHARPDITNQIRRGENPVHGDRHGYVHTEGPTGPGQSPRAMTVPHQALPVVDGRGGVAELERGRIRILDRNIRGHGDVESRL